MRSFTRLSIPDFLEKNAEKWNNSYKKRKSEKPDHVFQWKTFEKQKVNHRLLIPLKKQTQEHCSYCDFFPPRMADESIDHFLPKGNPLFYHHAYTWENLYFCCSHCQKTKMEAYDESLLRPDALDYSFERYFIINFSNFEIEPNPAATKEDQSRADVTIRILGFNLNGQPMARRHSYERYNQMPEHDLNDFAFRFVFD